ncbi:MAG: hypothetical protein IJT34_05770 [Butyrivibrio sp.]|nr:hypothetical protein [Butyrivibrio sp.]
MRKSIVCFMLAISFALITAGCEDGNVGNKREIKTPGSVDEVLFQEIPEETAAPGVDVDLTVLSSTMVYAEVYNMMVDPDHYKGKTVKMKGQFVPYYDESTGNNYFACLISDATACCSQGIEFILTDEYSYPEDYPKEGDIICVVGTFDTYMEGENMYCTLREAMLADDH